MNETKLRIKDQVIMILDDNEVFRAQTKVFFESQGAIVYASGSLDRGKAILAGLFKDNKPPALIILDFKLHNTYEMEALHRLHKIHFAEPIPIVIISSGFSTIALEKMKLYGAVAYVEKPVILEHFLNFCQEVLNELKNSESVVVEDINHLNRAG